MAFDLRLIFSTGVMGGEGMLASEVQVQVDRLREAATFAAGKADAIRDELTKLDNSVGKELLVDGWQGRAASAYDESWKEWKQGAETVIAALGDTSSLLSAVAVQFEVRDAANAAAITGVSSLDLPDL
ncbi:WXG100 family type VII secretion target [Nocardia noduli]|uniref:WXG100 family type VII secretion target n=1 Tax=Nocardia noduli TaxID=2815722 RepID=UPI0020B353D6|nr:WXG100 family type VII secretion target [Nocardia noduli]